MKTLMGVLLVAALALPARAADEEPGWTKLFNGKDLTGWKTYPRGTGKWKVEDGAIVGSGSASHLFTERDDFIDFHLRAEVQINDAGNSGMYFRTQFAQGFPPGYEAQINSTHRDPVKTGSLYPDGRQKFTAGEVKAMRVTDMLVKPDEWFTYEVVCKGDHIVIKVNGKTTVDFKDQKNRFAKGHFAFQQHHEGSVVKVRKVEVKEFKSEK